MKEILIKVLIAVASKLIDIIKEKYETMPKDQKAAIAKKWSESIKDVSFPDASMEGK